MEPFKNHLLNSLFLVYSYKCNIEHKNAVYKNLSIFLEVKITERQAIFVNVENGPQ